MAALRATLAMLSVTVLVCALPLPVSAGTKRKPEAKATAKPEPPPEPVPAPEPVKLTPEQMPAVPPQVIYHAGQLTIVAENSTLGDILRAVRTQTGAAVDVPANANSRVATRLGPGPVREVLASLLNGSLFNYVMIGTAADPNALARVILTPRPAAAPATQPAAAQYSAIPQQPMYHVPPQVDTDDNDNENAADEPPAPPEQPQNEQNGQPGVKTPEQLLQELQQQQLQLQQRMQQPPGRVPEPTRPPQQ